MLRFFLLTLVAVLGLSAPLAQAAPPAPTLAQVAACDTLSLAINMVNGKPMTLSQARHIPIGATYAVPVVNETVSRVMRKGDNPWALCREELVLHAQHAQTQTPATVVAAKALPSRAATTVSTVRLGMAAGNASGATKASIPHFDTAPIVAVTQEKLSPIAAPTVVDSAGQTYFVSATPPSSGAWWTRKFASEPVLTVVQVVLFCLLAIILVWMVIFTVRSINAYLQEIYAGRKHSSLPPTPTAPVQAANEERAPIPQGAVDVGFILRIPGESDVPFKASGEVSRDSRTVIIGDKQQQCFAIDGFGPWHAYLPLPAQKAAKTVRIATFNNSSGTLDVECAELNREVRAAISPETIEPTKLDTAIRNWLTAHGIDWKKMGLDVEDVRGSLIFPAKACGKKMAQQPPTEA